MRIRTLARLALVVLALGAAQVASGAAIDMEGQAALKKLYETQPAAKTLAAKAEAILVFPNIVKAGFMVGAQFGEGVLFDRKGKVRGHYDSMAASYGLQAGAQAFGYALFFMNKKALKYLDKSDGWEIGVGPSIVIVDEGIGKSITSTTITQDVYAFIFDQAGLMAGVGIQGSKITRVK